MRRVKSSESLWRFFEIFALCGLVIAQPAFDYIAGSTRWIIAIQVDWVSVIAFTCLALLLPPLAIWVIESFALRILGGDRWRSTRELLHAAILAGLVGLLVNSWLKPGGMPVRYRLLISGFVGIVALIGRMRWAVVKTFFHSLAFAPLFYLVLFLLSPGTIGLAEASIGHAYPQQVRQAPKRIVILVFDELPLMSLLDGSGQVDESLFPAFSELAKSSTWYRNSTTNASHTLRAFPTLISGTRPVEEKVNAPSARNFPVNLFSLLGKAYKMNVHEAHEALCPDSVCTDRNPYPTQHGLPALKTLGERSAASKIKPISDNPPVITDIVAPPALVRANEFIKTLKPSKSRVLDYGHIMLPHQPWRYSGPEGFDTGFKDLEYGEWESPLQAKLGKQQHLLTLQTADTFLGNVIDQLKKTGIFDQALLIVTADHGIAFISSERARIPTNKNYPGIVWTPLFIKAPGQIVQQVTDQPVDSIDLLPTILDYTGSTRTPTLAGHSIRKISPGLNRATVVVAAGDVGGPGSNLRLNRVSGFNSVLAAKNWPGALEDDLRLYRVGRYGGLVGESVGATAPLPLDTAPAIKTRIVTNFDPKAKSQPLLLIRGTVKNPNTRTVAVAVNGIIAGLSPVERNTSLNLGSIAISMNPHAFRKGRNVLRAYSVTGETGAEVLTPIPFPR